MCATRLGIGTMLGGAGTRSMFGRTTLAGSYLFTVNLETRFKEGGNGLAALPALSPALLDEFNVAMAAVTLVWPAAAPTSAMRANKTCR